MTALCLLPFTNDYFTNVVVKTKVTKLHSVIGLIGIRSATGRICFLGFFNSRTTNISK